MDYLFYPGCALESSTTHYYKSTHATAKALGIGLRDLDDWSCCGATAYIGTNEEKAVAYSARNLALAESAGASNLVTACSGCYVMLRKAQKLFVQGPEIRDRVAGALAAAGLTYSGAVRARHFADVLLNDVGPDKIAERVRVNLGNVRIAPYHGCQLSRPFSDLDSPEKPTLLNRLLAPTGAEIVPFPLTSKCCGGMLMTTRREVGLRLTWELLSCARQLKADCLAVACPLCCVNLECYQSQIARQYDWGKPLPVVPFTQILGVALGVPASELALDQCYVAAEPLMAVAV
jgi:heterodisulfide reductase subunit B